MPPRPVTTATGRSQKVPVPLPVLSAGPSARADRPAGDLFQRHAGLVE